MSSNSSVEANQGVGPNPSGAWLRLKCCDHSVHPVRIEQHHEGVLIISAPKEPHEDWIEVPTQAIAVVVGWTDHHGSTVLECRVIPESLGDSWALEVISATDFAQRRRHRRVRTDAVAHLLSDYSNQSIPVKVLDISEGGMRCSFTDYVPQDNGSPMRFMVNIDGAALLFLAQLRWTGRVSPIEIHAGVEFVNIHESTTTIIRAHVIKQLDRNM